MNRIQAESIIIEQCDSTDGFLAVLRTHANFDESKFILLRDAIKEYVDAVENDDVLSRQLIGCLFYLNEVLGSMTLYFTKRNMPDAENVTFAHAEIWDLIDKLISSKK
jgi:hypothetical protein